MAVTFSKHKKVMFGFSGKKFNSIKYLKGSKIYLRYNLKFPNRRLFFIMYMIFIKIAGHLYKKLYLFTQQ